MPETYEWAHEKEILSAASFIMIIPEIQAWCSFSLFKDNFISSIISSMIIATTTTATTNSSYYQESYD